ncbi:hypothetical protein RclHR1_03370009 [Rhizophagus clarus]|uniref:Uncharacterized protein n=1 Tax=Rhizophagus clarus TaxID=94130 RepID=A0A2Z6RDB0_9GLOM|nr:hypothetical protein RclHR1_03370009 [Rhizophagus clarus]
MKVPRKNKISSSVVYTKPTKEQKEYYKQKPVVENTHLCNVHLLYISLIKLFNKLLSDKKYSQTFGIKVKEVLLNEKHDQTFKIKVRNVLPDEKHDQTFGIKVKKDGKGIKN